MTQTVRIAGGFSGTLTGTPDGGQSRIEQVLDFALELANGTGAGKANKMFVDTDRALTSGASEDFDFAGGVTDAQGNVVTCTKVKCIAIRAKSTNTVNLTIGGATSEASLFFTAAGDKATLAPGDWLVAFSAAGWTIGAGSTDDLKILAGAADSLFDIGFIGEG